MNRAFYILFVVAMGSLFTHQWMPRVSIISAAFCVSFMGMIYGYLRGTQQRSTDEDALDMIRGWLRKGAKISAIDRSRFLVTNPDGTFYGGLRIDLTEGEEKPEFARCIPRHDPQE